jgi:hypothetical protein
LIAENCSSVSSIQGKYAAAVRLNTGEQTKLAAQLAAAKTKQAASIAAINKGWETMSSASRIKILSASEQLALAINQAATMIRSAKGTITTPPAPGAKTKADLLGDGKGGVDKNRPPAPNPPASKPGVPSNAFGSPGINFSSLSKAVAFENKHKPPGSSLVVANSSETIIPAAYGFIPSQGMYSSSRSGMSSAPISVSAPITIHQQPGQDAEELASMVAMKIGEAVAQARSASVFV